MGKLKKLKGGMALYVTEDEKLLANSNTRNGVYVYDLDTMKPVFQTRTVSNVAQKAISPDKKLLAAKNTSGQMALISMESGEEICRNDMANKEGYQMTFAVDGKTVLDFDWDGRTMSLTESNEFRILDGLKADETDKNKPMEYLHYDRFSRQIYKLAQDKDPRNGKFAFISPADADNLEYRPIHKFTNGLPAHTTGISICKDHIYYLSNDRTELIETDKSFEETRVILLPPELRQSRSRVLHMYVSPYEKYAFFYMGFSSACLYDLTTMELVMEFGEDVTSDFTMINEDKTFIIAAWGGTYVGEI